MMWQVAPAGPMYQAGTLSGNPLAMTAGIETLKRLKQPGTYEQLDRMTEKLINGILDAARAARRREVEAAGAKLEPAPLTRERARPGFERRPRSRTRRAAAARAAAARR